LLDVIILHFSGRILHLKAVEKALLVVIVLPLSLLTQAKVFMLFFAFLLFSDQPQIAQKVITIRFLVFVGAPIGRRPADVNGFVVDEIIRLVFSSFSDQQ